MAYASSRCEHVGLTVATASMTTYIADQADIAIAERLAPPDNARGEQLFLYLSFIL